MAIAAKTARYIKLDTKSQEISTLDFRNIWLTADAVTDELAREGDLEKIERYLVQQGYSPRAAADGAREAKDFYSLGVDCLWITFARGHLWWTFANPQVIWITNDLVLTNERIRKSVDGWRNSDIWGMPINIDGVSDTIRKLAVLGPTDPASETLCNLLQLINGRAASTQKVVGRPAQVRNEQTSFIQVPSKLFTVADVIKRPSAAPNEAGLYAWWFDDLPNVPLEGAREQEGFRLAYIGIASAREGSPRTLKMRLSNHCNGPIATSTLRRSLAALLMAELNLQPIRSPGQKTWLAEAGEFRLTEWLAKHARITWTASATPWLLEEDLLRNGPPLALNIVGNKHAFVPELRVLRRQLSDLPLSVD
jgi:hypothetical protein